jgi:LPXTG-motif cell wall-anchored protein
MKIFLNIVGVLLILVGGVWFLQGINVLPGSLMSGQTQWAVYGGLAVLIGIGSLVFANRRKASRQGD